MMGVFGRFLRQNVVALLALFIALGGTAYAATSLPRNSVGTKQLKKGAVTGTKIKNHTIAKKKIAKKTLAALKGNTGPQGPVGPTGATGAQGPQGDPGPTAAAFASTNVPHSIVSSGPVPVLSLSTPSSGANTTSTGKLSVPFGARILIEANTTISTSSTSIHSGQCNLVLTNAANQTTSVGQYVFFNQSQVGVTDVHLTGAADEPVGTYDVTLQCVADTSEAYRSDLVAVAVAR